MLARASCAYEGQILTILEEYSRDSVQVVQPRWHVEQGQQELVARVRRHLLLDHVDSVLNVDRFLAVLHEPPRGCVEQIGHLDVRLRLSHVVVAENQSVDVLLGVT